MNNLSSVSTVANTVGAGGSSTVGIGDVTIGFSASGLTAYLNDVKLELLDSVEETLTGTNKTTLFNTISAGWVGVSRDKFLKQFDDMVQVAIEDIKAEYEDLMTRFNEIQSNYFEQDSKMIGDE